MADEQNSPYAQPDVYAIGDKRHPEAQSGYRSLLWGKLGLQAGGATAPIDCSNVESLHAQAYNVRSKYFTLYVDDTTSITPNDYYALRGGGTGAAATSGQYLRFKAIGKGDRVAPAAGSLTDFDKIILCKRATLTELADEYDGVFTDTDSYNYGTSYFDTGWPSSYIDGEIRDNSGAALSTECKIGTSTDQAAVVAYGAGNGVSASSAYGDNATENNWASYQTASSYFKAMGTYDMNKYPVATHGQAAFSIDRIHPDNRTGFTVNKGNPLLISNEYYDSALNGISWNAYGKIQIVNPPKFLKFATWGGSTTAATKCYVSNWSLSVWLKLK